MAYTLLALFSLLVQATDGQPLARRVGGQIVLRGTLSVKALTISGEMKSVTMRVTGTLVRSTGGLLTSYRRKVRSVEKNHLVSLVVLREHETGYELREVGPLGSRTLNLNVAPVSMIVDGEWPEALIPILTARQRGFLRVLDLGTKRVELVEIMPRLAGARYLDLKSGGPINWNSTGSSAVIIFVSGLFSRATEE